MNSRSNLYLTLICLALTISNCLGQNSSALLLRPNVGQIAVKKPFLHQFTNTQRPGSLSAIRRLPIAQWQSVNSVNFGSKGGFGWATFEVQSPVEQTLWLELTSHFIDSVQVWLIREPDLPGQSIRTYAPTGFRLLARDPEAPTRHRYFLKPVHLLANVRYAVYIRGWVPPADVLKFGVTLWSPSAFLSYQQRDIAGWAVFIGLVLMSVFITLISYVFHPRRIYLYYCGYVLCISKYALLNDGWGMFLPTWHQWFDSTSTVVHWLSAGILFLMLFTRNFLSVNPKAGWWWLQINPVGLFLLVEIVTFVLDYGIRHNHFTLVQAGYKVGFGLLAIYPLLWLSYIADAIRRRFRPVWLYIASVLVWVAFYIINVFVVNTGWMTEPFPDMLVFRVALLAEIGFIFVGWMYRQRIIRESEQRLQTQQQHRQQQLLDTERQRQAEELKALRLQNELQQQRERLARDLHDGIGSQLTHIAGRLDILSMRKTDEQTQLQRLGNFTRETNQSLRDTVWILNRSEIPLSTFSQRLHIYLLRLWEDIDSPRLDWHPSQLSADQPTIDPILPPLVVQCLFRIAQEAVNNALKYAGSTTIDVGLTHHATVIILTVADNGIGFDPSTSTNGYGLTNMQKRAEETGGQWSLTSDSTGTRIDVTIDMSGWLSEKVVI